MRMKQKIGVFFVAVLVSINIQGAQLQWPTEPYSLYSYQDQLGEVIRSLASSHGIPIVVSEKISEAVSIQFNRVAPAELFSTVVDSYNLTWYYDGSTLYVYTIDELLTSTLKLNTLSALDFENTIKDLEIFDDRFPWRTVEHKNLIYFTGPPRLVALIHEMARQLDVRPKQPTNIVYRWKGENGVTHFSSAPPAIFSVEQVEILTMQISAVSQDPVINPAVTLQP